MSYSGTSIGIPVGQLGLKTDDAQTSLPPNALIKANNISLYSGRIEKVKGATKYNATPLTSSIVAVADWFPSPTLQRLIACTSDGKIWRDTGSSTFSANTPIATGLASLTTDTHMVTGGAESASRNKKLFILSASNQIKVLSGDASAVTSISTPSPDWAAGNYPTFGIMYQGRFCVMGSAADPHRLYFSTLDNHEDFTSGTPAPPTFSVFPGEGTGIKCAAVYKGILFIFKDPYGVYVLDGRDPDNTNWTLSKYADSFGVASPHTVIEVLGDLIAANSIGSYTSLQASAAFGDFIAGDILANAQIENYIRGLFNPVGIPYSHALYYPEKKLALFTAQSSSTLLRDRMLVVDVSRQQPRISVGTKDNANCLALRKDSQGIQRPMYGTADGYVYFMDKNTYNVGSTPYTGEAQTAYTDMSFASGELAGKNKIFEFLEVNYVPTDNSTFHCDVYVDGALKQTLDFTQLYGAELDSFVLDVDRLAAEPVGARNRKPLKSCTGVRISFRFYNSGSNQAFKVERLVVGFRLSDEKLYSAQVY
jgi:hypothetical protein